jgi:very-short-patch-repair endonuclease
MPSPLRNIFPECVTAVTRVSHHASRSGLLFGDERKSTSLRRPLGFARRGAQRPSPLPPLQASWRGEGHTCLGGAMSRRRRKIRFSKELRQRSTYTEKIAWNLLRDGRCLGLKFRRQYGISGFIIDFYCYELRLAVEIDGTSHLGREDYDLMRQRELESEGIRFIRLPAYVLIESPEKLIESIQCFVASQPDAFGVHCADKGIRTPLSSLPGEGAGVRSW